ncbi:unnamed protein product [Auanema sp. JU1783]|nr:unnamed protein product [Auanema sp. JU1783]
MASRRQKQFDRKYSSFKRYTATEDVNYSSHSSKSSYRSESLTSRSDSRGRSTHFEVVAGSDTRSFPVYIAIQDYQPDASEVEGIALEQGQIVEVLDKKNAARWLVRTKARPPQSGWVPGSYFETPTEYYKQRRKTREIEHPSANLSEEQEAILKRDQVYHDLLRSEEEFVTDLRVCIDEFVNPLNDSSIPDEVQKYKEILKTNLTELYQFHANVMLKGLNYYSDDPGKVGQTFVRLEHDFDQHVQFYKDLPTLLEKLENPPIKEYFESLADKCEAGARSYADHLKNVADRMTHYQNYFKEFVKYSARANVSTKSMQKALELCICVPQRVNDLVYTDNIKEYPGDTNKLGRLIRHDMFKVEEGEGNPPNERYVFLFNNKVMITEKLYTEPVSYKHYATIRLDKYSVRTHSISEDVIILKPNEQGLPSFTLTPTDVSQAEFVRKAWLRDIAEEHEEYG